MQSVLTMKCIEVLIPIHDTTWMDLENTFAKDHILYDSNDMKCPELANP